MREELESLGISLGEQDFSAIILESLSKSYDQFISAVTATTSILKQELSPEDLMQTTINKYDQWSGTKEKNIDAAFFAGSNNQGGKKKSNKDVECFNCHKKGHKKVNCWVKRGGQDPGQSQERIRRNPTKKNS
jgi:hypothetical protein